MTEQVRVAVDGYIVVCSDLHISCGPYTSERAAEKAAIQLTMLSLKNGSGCEYTLVPFLAGERMSALHEPKKEEAAPIWHGGYL